MSALRVAVVGAGGHIGRTLLERLAADGAIAARGICRNELTAAPLRLAGYDIRCGAASDPVSAQSLVGDCDVVVNCAAATALPGTMRFEERALLRGLLGVQGPRRLVHFSSVAVYGTCITDKNRYERPRPDHPFGRDKLDLERYLRARAGSVSPLRIAVVRMGHVYGAEQWVSRYVLDQLDKGGFCLPFDGRLASNAVHVRNVAAAVRALVADDRVGTFNLFDHPQATWRQVFDWTTGAAGLSPLPGLDDAVSGALRAHYTRISRSPAAELAREVAAWGRSLPISLASSSQQVRFLVMGLMAAVQSPRLEAHIVKRFFGEHLARRSTPPAVDLSALFSEAAPGPCLEYAPEVGVEDARALKRWREGYASPEALAPFPPRPRDWAEAQA